MMMPDRQDVPLVFLLATLFALGVVFGSLCFARVVGAQIVYGPNHRSGGVVGNGPGIVRQAPAAPPPVVWVQPPTTVLPAPAVPQPGTPAYGSDECIGTVVNGVCNGSVIDTDPARKRCYGRWLPNGTCTGPLF